MKDFSGYISYKRDKKVKFYIHKGCNEDEVIAIIHGMGFQAPNVLNDDDAHVVNCTNNCVGYRVKNEVYIVPATIKAVVNNGDNKMHLWFDYPLDMDRKDLVKY